MVDHRSSSGRLPGRRDVVLAGVGAFVVGILPVAARRPPRIVRRTMPVMGTVAEVAVVHRDADLAGHAIDAAFRELTRVERLMTRFARSSDVGRVNGAAGRDAVTVDPETADVVRSAVEWAAASGGRFDPALGIVSEAWDVTNRNEPPAAAVLDRLAGRALYHAVDVGSWRGSTAIALTDPDARLDLGGIAKGHGVDRAVAALRDLGVWDGLVTVGGDLYAMGRRPDGEAWRVGIRSPEEPSRLIGTLDASDEAVATSGDYERFFRYRGTVYHHLMDPFTAAPIRATHHSVTVRAACCRDADAGATAAFGLEPEESARLLAAARRASLIGTG